jgi:hypothetical protein
MLPTDFIAFHKMTKAIAKEANIVEAESNLIVKDEDTSGGGDTASDKS